MTKYERIKDGNVLEPRAPALKQPLTQANAQVSSPSWPWSPLAMLWAASPPLHPLHAGPEPSLVAAWWEWRQLGCWSSRYRSTFPSGPRHWQVGGREQQRPRLFHPRGEDSFLTVMHNRPLVDRSPRAQETIASLCLLGEGRFPYLSIQRRPIQWSVCPSKMETHKEFLFPAFCLRIFRF